MFKVNLLFQALIDLTVTRQGRATQVGLAVFILGAEATIGRKKAPPIHTLSGDTLHRWNTLIISDALSLQFGTVD